MHEERGQSTVEYAALVALVAVVFALGGVVFAPGVANAVGRAVMRALCQVSGGGCATLSPAPCVVRSSTLKGGLSARVVLLRVGRDSAIVRAERSDGTVEVTLLDNLSAGLAASLGARGRLSLGEHAVGTGAVAEAALVAALGGGRTWRLRGRPAADRLVRRLEVVLAGRAASSLPLAGPVLDLGQRLLGKGAHAHLPVPDSRTESGGVSGEAKALLGPLAGVSGKLGAVVGRRRARDGTTTWFVRVSAQAGAPVASALGVEGGGELSLALGYDRRGRPQALTVAATGTVSRSAALSGLLAGRGVRGRGGRVQVNAALDLGDADDRARAHALLRALSPAHAGELPRAVGALAHAIADHAAIDVAAYGEKRASVGLDVDVGTGVGIGVGAEVSRADQRLTGAWSRPPHGAWETRLDCLT